MARSEFNPSVRIAAWERCKGKCENPACGAKLYPGKFHYDHDQADGLGGKPTLENCKVLCVACHHEKTVTHDGPLMDKADAIKKKFIGAEKSKRPWRNTFTPRQSLKCHSCGEYREDCVCRSSEGAKQSFGRVRL